jgi:hypothetical protein
MQRYRHQKFIRFLNAVEHQVPAGKTVNAILDKRHSQALGGPEIAGRHPHWTFHFNPTSSSWLNTSPR